MKGVATSIEKIMQPVTNGNINDMTMALLNRNSRKQQQQQQQLMRGSHLVNRHDVRGHISQFLIHGGDCSTNNDDGYVTNVDIVNIRYAIINDYVSRIESYHRSLIFCPSLPMMRDSNEDKNKEGEDEEVLRLSMPAGLRNLGATCYLNSQLQCLAQNLGLISGLFSLTGGSRTGGGDREEVSNNNATTADVDERMSSILSHMQSILARLRYGPDRVICTNDFALALGLENNEMQDPNEV